MANIRPLPAILAEKARVELNEDPKRVPEDIQHLKDWILKNPHLNARTDDQWLLSFLRGCKFSLERTKEKLDLYYSIRNTAPELFQIKHTDPKFDEILSMGVLLPLPIAGPDAVRVSLFCIGKYDTDKYNILDTMGVSLILQKIMLMEDDNAIVCGGMSIIDLEGVTMGHFLQMTPMAMKKMVAAGQDAAPFRMKGAHYLNTPPGFETVFNAMKPLLNEKNQTRLYVHNKNYDAMHEYIPKNILPPEYGGNGWTLEENIAYWKNKVKEYNDFLEEDYKYGTDESKRPGKPKTAEDMFGVEGSFRKLELD